MKIYLAGYFNGKASVYDISVDDYSYFLESYHYLKKDYQLKIVQDSGHSIFLDSGAFSAFTQGAIITLEEYTDFIARYKDLIHVASNLDIIGKGNEEGSYKNLAELRAMADGRHSVPICPVHHARDADRWLARYLDEGNDYIFLGGMVPESTPYLKGWLDHVWDKFLADKDGMPKVKVHGFGMTRPGLMDRYPWFSVDSTSWVMTGRFGGIFMEIGNQTKKVMISSDSPRTKDVDCHFDTLPAKIKSQLTEEIIAQGFDPEELRTIYWKRDIWNIAYLKRQCDKPVTPFCRRSILSLF